ncbi:MAG: hypothetical protein PUP91_18175 [Rhizonema sp. PD37]|nr:hypothetical protein [Rhizonema sp. PD37]
MLKKSLAFGLLAFGLMVAPTTAFAGQSQGNVQNTEQNGAATNGSTTAQNSESINNQVQAQVNKARHGIAYGPYRRYRSNYPVHSTPQSQHSAQHTAQNGAATDGSTTAQSSNTHNNQTQAAYKRRSY